MTKISTGRKKIKKQRARTGTKSKLRKQRKQQHGKKSVQKTSFQSVTRKIKQNMLKQKPKNINSALKIALKTIENNRIRSPRIIKIPKTGGILPLIPIFAALSALGALSGGAAGIAKAVNDARAAKDQLKESQRHNQTMESLAIGKGLYLKPYKTGLGLFLRQRPQLTPFR